MHHKCFHINLLKNYARRLLSKNERLVVWMSSCMKELETPLFDFILDAYRRLQLWLVGEIFFVDPLGQDVVDLTVHLLITSGKYFI